MASRLRSARAAVRRVGGLLRSGQPAAAAGQGGLHTSVQEPGADPTAEAPLAAAVDGSAAEAAPHCTARQAAAGEGLSMATPEGLQLELQALSTQALLGMADSVLAIQEETMA